MNRERVIWGLSLYLLAHSTWCCGEIDFFQVGRIFAHKQSLKNFRGIRNTHPLQSKLSIRDSIKRVSASSEGVEKIESRSTKSQCCEDRIFFICKASPAEWKMNDGEMKEIQQELKKLWPARFACRATVEKIFVAVWRCCGGRMKTKEIIGCEVVFCWLPAPPLNKHARP
jgi:hypothetical protein